MSNEGAQKQETAGDNFLKNLDTTNRLRQALGSIKGGKKDGVGGKIQQAKRLAQLVRVFSTLIVPLFPFLLFCIIIVVVFYVVSSTFGINDSLSRTLTAIESCSNGVDFNCVKDVVTNKSGDAIENFSDIQD